MLMMTHELFMFVVVVVIGLLQYKLVVTGCCC